MLNFISSFFTSSHFLRDLSFQSFQERRRHWRRQARRQAINQKKAQLAAIYGLREQ